MHLLASTLAESREDTLGLALLNSNHAAAHIGRIRDVVAANPGLIDLPILLGYVIAHEIGHILLRSHAHPKHGIMRGNFAPDELALMGQLRLKFTRQEQDAARPQLTAMQDANARLLSMPASQSR